MELFTPGHFLLLAVVALILFFGWKQLPDMARSLGRSLRVFKTEIKGMSSDDDARKQADEGRTESVRSEPAAIEAPKATPRPRPTPNADVQRAEVNRTAGNAR